MATKSMPDTYSLIRTWTRRYLRETTDDALLPWPGLVFADQPASVHHVTTDKRGNRPSIRGTWTNGAWTRVKLSYHLSLIDRLMSGRYDPRTFEGGLVMGHSPAAHDWLWHYKALVDAQP